MRTAAANEKRARQVDERYAERLKSRGWHVVPPEDTQRVVDRLRELLDEAEDAHDGE